ncbi:hypothetical protein [Clostridium beijerinckii]|uniref:hypothetical protein n=1 Tax=Clostridium beijerinckii TaxID=1520 RepID=UPI0002E52296|nr:hypothetical protein [Clostridium beijerinckii]
MNSTIQYGCFRYFLVPYDQIQTSLFNNALPNRKALIENIIVNAETSMKIEENTYDGKYKLYLVTKIDEDNYLLQLGKHASIKCSEDTGSGFQDSKIDDYPYIHIFINTKEQILLFEKKTKAFRDFTSSSKAFSIYISDRIEDSGYEFKCEEINSPNSFWTLIDNSTSINSLTLTLYSPNLFDGITPAEEAARDLENATNSTENILTFKNKHGKLKLAKEKLKTFIQYISSGGGSWCVNAIVPNKNSKTFSSKNEIKTLNLPEDISNRSAKSLSTYISKTIESINNKPGDDNLDG